MTTTAAETPNNSCVILHDFLDEETNKALFDHAISLKERFGHTQTAGKDGNGVLNEKWRHSNSLMGDEYRDFAKLLKTRIRTVLPAIIEKLGMEPFEPVRLETHLTSHNDGEFYKPHIDNGSGALRGRQITYVYYFHSQPRAFSGGQLLFLKNDPKPLIVEPDNNTIVFFNASLLHAVHPVSCPSGLFEHGRFTLNGWVWKQLEQPATETPAE